MKDTKTIKKCMLHGKLTALLLAVLLSLGSFTSAVLAADAVNFLQDASFEKTYEEGKTPPYTLGGTAARVDGGYDGTKSVALTKAGDSVTFIVNVTNYKSTNFNFSFWMKNSVEDSLTMDPAQNFYMIDYKSYDELIAAGDSRVSWIINGADSVIKYIGPYAFGDTRVDDGIQWRKVTINFTTPHSYLGQVQIGLACAKDDPELRVDDIRLEQTGKAPNRAFNGDFEALDESTDGFRAQGFTPSTFAADTSNEPYSIREENGNHYLHFDTKATTNGYVRRLVWPQGTIYGPQTSDTVSRYKMSMKVRMSGSYIPMFYWYNGDGASKIQSDISNVFPSSKANTWETYTVYVNMNELVYNNILLNERLDVVHGRYNKYAMDIDDVYAWYDSNSIDFYKELTFADFSVDPANSVDAGSPSGANRFYRGAYTPAYINDVFSVEKTIGANSLDELKPDTNGDRTVIVRAHYLPIKTGRTSATTDDGTTWTDVQFKTEKVMLLACVYKMDEKVKDAAGNVVKQLYSVKMATDESSDGKVLDAVATVKVPTSTDNGVSYKVEAFALDGNTLKAMVDEPAELLETTE